jgi:hypothetical protein
MCHIFSTPTPDPSPQGGGGSFEAPLPLNLTPTGATIVVALFPANHREFSQSGVGRTARKPGDHKVAPIGAKLSHADSSPFGEGRVGGAPWGTAPLGAISVERLRRSISNTLIEVCRDVVRLSHENGAMRYAYCALVLAS